MQDASGGQPFIDGIRELAAPRRHGQTITRLPVVSYTTFSPLPALRPAVVFFYLNLPSPAASIFRSGAPCAARTFLPHHQDAGDRPMHCFHCAKIIILLHSASKKNIVFRHHPQRQEARSCFPKNRALAFRKAIYCILKDHQLHFKRPLLAS